MFLTGPTGHPRLGVFRTLGEFNPPERKKAATASFRRAFSLKAEHSLMEAAFFT